jgi:hypothetical protein
MNKQEINNKVKSLKEMINSCFTYGGADIESYNFKRYIEPYREAIGEKQFFKEYSKHLEHLKKNATIKTNVYTDYEGCTYNTLEFN